MWSTRDVFGISILIFAFASRLRAYRYRGVAIDEDIFEDCPEQPEGVLGFTGLFDISELTINSTSDGIVLSGNTTAVWDIEPSDRIQGRAEIFAFQRSTWQPTLLAIVELNLCPAFFEENSNWYKYWTQHIINKDEIKNECLNPGTKLLHEEFKLEYYVDTHVNNLDGIYKLRFKLQAATKMNTLRPTSICFEARGEINRV